jgi:HEAT repeat protein
MIKKIFKSTILLFFVVLSTAIAQDRRTLDTKIADILAQMPANDEVHTDRLMQEIIALGPEGFAKISGMLTEPGAGDDTAVRFAFNGLARYASDFGREGERQYVEENLLRSIAESSSEAIRTFLIRQLNLVGGPQSLQPLSAYLHDDGLVEPATQALLSMGSEAPSDVLLQALEGVSGKGRITIIRALGEIRCRRAVAAISDDIDSEQPALRKAALAALASIGHPDSYKTLYKAAKEVSFFYEPGNAVADLLLYTDRLGEDGNYDLCKKACTAIIKASQSQDLLHNQTAALDIYTHWYGYDAMPLLLKAVDNSDKAFRMSVLRIAEPVGGIAGTKLWIEKAGESSGEPKADIVAMLGRRGDERAIDFVTDQLNDPSSLVRGEAIRAMVRLGKRDVVPALIGHLAAGRDLESTKVALLQLIDNEHLGPVAEKLGSTEGAAKAAVVDIIAARSGERYFDDIMELTDANDQIVRAAAYSGLHRVATAAELQRLINLLLQVNADSEIDGAQKAVVGAVQGAGEETPQILLDALDKTGKKARIIEILPQIGGAKALQKVSDYFSNSSGALRETAFEALTEWQDYAVSGILYEIAEKEGGTFHRRALEAFVQRVDAADVPDDQKLLQFRKAMQVADASEEKVMIVQAIGDLKTFLSLVYLGQFLDQPALQQTTARAVMDIALPGSANGKGFSGAIVRGLLERTVQVMAGPESEYYKINIRKYLDEMPEEKGFVSMFNGKNLDGWQGFVANPIAVENMSEREYERKLEEANEKMRENWSVRDGMIVFNGHGANLCSVKEYGDFELIVDWRITKNGDSGIYLRGTPQVQIWDTARVEVGAQVGSGGLYNNKVHESKPLKVADNPIGEWNTFHITMVGENVTVYLNGELVVDNVPMENYWDRSIPIFKEGPIELQAHGSDLAFRDIYVREINTAEYNLTEQEKADGFSALFNGRNLDGWQGNKTDYFVEDGAIVLEPTRGGHGNLFTEKEYSDFVFRFEFQLTPGANNGLGVRAPLQGDAAYDGMEVQILDNTAPVYANLKDYQYHGSVYGVIAAKRGFLKPVGSWNEQEVKLEGSKVRVILNGHTILEGDLQKASANGTLDGRDHPGLKREQGYIGFLGHGSELKFRNIRIKEL